MNLITLKNKNTQEVSTLLNIQERSNLIEKFSTLGLPHKMTEEYHYFDVEKILDVDYKILDYIPKTKEEGDKIEIVDGVVTKAPKGLRVYSEVCERNHRYGTL